MKLRQVEKILKRVSTKGHNKMVRHTTFQKMAQVDCRLKVVSASPNTIMQKRDNGFTTPASALFSF